MGVVFPHDARRRETPYGSRSLAISQRVASGSTLVTDDVDIVRDEVKTFGFRGNVGGSWQIQVAFVGTNQYFTAFEGTFPASRGSIKVASFTEAYRRARGRITPNATGSVSVFFGGLSKGV